MSRPPDRSLLHRFRHRLALMGSLVFLAGAFCVLPARASSDSLQPRSTPQWRPALHFTPQAHWMNDPNGPFLVDGVWHLFYQYNPRSMVWGHTSWGHATSRDLVHWQEQAIALPATSGRDIFSGSVVVDTANRSGLGLKGIAPLIALYTSVYTGNPRHPDGTQAQSLAFSRNRGQTWQNHPLDPVLTLSPDSRQFRDPSLTWYEPGRFWVMTTVVADAQIVKLYRSTDLIHWDFLSDFQPPGYRKPGMLWEMPTLMSLPLDGHPEDRRWVMIVSVNPWSIAGGSGVEYYTGRFDGTRFTSDRLPPDGSDPAAYHWLDHGADNYAAIRFANTGDAPPCLISWMSNWAYADTVPTAPWRGQMTLPVTLSLRTLNNSPHLYQAPAPDYALFVRKHPAQSWLRQDLATNGVWRPAMRHSVADITFTLRGAGSGRSGIILRESEDRRQGTRLSYDFGSKLLTLDRTHSGNTGFSDRFSLVHVAHLDPEKGAVTLHVVMDRSSIEVFANDGALRMTDLIFPDRESDRLSFFAEDAPATLENLRITGLDP
ncbi:glycoside hydrolase family 32 protein [Asaia krungthepensis]|uniref:Beta-fructosidase n=1 Tax=Asaia krungthepensis NRIC 0535 TaxID=1307925 RepID=A0ABQ0Q234_9PROT|nr:glycoside hydrolase family 32 protein [Asaia krungthepensis]GBQ87680.1 beta-fructosidase [Asaia krungthepensis NRIC 0535]